MRTSRWVRSVALVTLMVISSAMYAQDAGRGVQRPAAGRVGRPNVPPAGTAGPQEVEAMLDAWALVQSERELQLTAEQYPNFVSRFTRLQNIRRRITMERRRQLRELSGLLTQSPAAKDEDIMAKIKGFDDITRRTAEEVQKVYLEVDSVLTPWQRGRFRLFEEQLERRKIDLLRTLGPGRAGGAGGAGS